VLNPVLAELAARDRIAELRRASAKRSLGAQSRLDADLSGSERPLVSIRDARRSRPQRALGWFLVSVGLRLALPRTRAGSGR
jgi:hypothetical protein